MITKFSRYFLAHDKSSKYVNQLRTLAINWMEEKGAEHMKEIKTKSSEPVWLDTKWVSQKEESQLSQVKRGCGGTKLGPANETYHICQYINMNIKVNRSHGLLGYRCKELGAVCQTQSSMRKSRNLVKSMGSKKRKRKKINYITGKGAFLHCQPFNFPRSATFY